MKKKQKLIISFIVIVFVTVFSLPAYATPENWQVTLEAEEAKLGGTALLEDFANDSGTTVSYLDNGEENYVLFEFIPPTNSGDIKIRLRSGENRRFYYELNGQSKLSDYVNNGDWLSFSDYLVEGVPWEADTTNTLKIYAPMGESGPGIDYIELSSNEVELIDQRLELEKVIVEARVKLADEAYTVASREKLKSELATSEALLLSPDIFDEQLIAQRKILEQLISELVKNAPDQEQLQVTFKLDNGQEPITILKEKGTQLLVEDLPQLINGDYDLLGWYYGPNQLYRLSFPFEIGNNDLVLTAKWGRHMPGTPLEKNGYRLIFSDEFDNGTELNPNLWVSKYLSSWSKKPELAQPTYEITNGIMNLQIREDTQPWCEEYDGQTIVSGFTTGNRNGLHNWNGNNEVRNPVETELTHINQYGFYEVRAKGQSGSSRHSAWWLLGFEDSPEESAEIDIFEILGKNSQEVPAAFHNWKSEGNFENNSALTYRDSSKNFNEEWHIYGFDWQEGTGTDSYPDKLILYVDGIKVGEKNVNIDYPMIQLFSLYEKRAGGWTGPWEWMPYPNSFEIDYARVYKKIPLDAQPVAKAELKIVEVEESELVIQKGKAELTQFESQVEGQVGTIYTEPNLPGTKSYVDVKWNDGVTTQEFVKWEPITAEDLSLLNNGQDVKKEGVLVNISSDSQVSLLITTSPEPEPKPYQSSNLGVANDQEQLAKLFDGNLISNSGEFVFETNALPENQEVSIEYDFKDSFLLEKLAMTTNYGNDQGIKKFKVASWDEQLEDWIEDEHEYHLNWTDIGNSEQGETLTIELNQPLKTSKVKLILTEIGLKWANKLAMREITFDGVFPAVVKPTLLNEVVGEDSFMADFRFKLVASDGSVLPNKDGSSEQIIEVSANQTANFDELIFFEEGVYSYLISSLNIDSEEYDMDDRIYELSVLIKKNLETSQLDYQIEISDGNDRVSEVVFQHIYTKKTEVEIPEKPEVPETPGKPEVPGKTERPVIPEKSETAEKGEINFIQNTANNIEASNVKKALPKAGEEQAVVTIVLGVVLISCVMYKVRSKEKTMND